MSTNTMPPKARLPGMAVGSVERNSSQKKQGKSRSKERQLKGQQQSQQMAVDGVAANIVRPFVVTNNTATEGTLPARGASNLAFPNQEGNSLQELTLLNNADSTETYQNLMPHHPHDGIGSGLRQRSKGPGAGAKQQQPLLQIPTQRPVYRLLQAFKLQQYSKNFIEQGYGDDVYKLTMITHRKKQELLDSIEMLPGHKTRLAELFRRIDQMYPRQNVTRMLDNATRVGSRQSQSRLSGGMTTTDSSVNVSSADKHGVSREGITTAQSTLASQAQATGIISAQHFTQKTLLHTQPVQLERNTSTQSQQPSGIPPPTHFPRSRGGGTGISSGKSPSSQGKHRKNNQASSLIRKFTGLENGTKQAINESFLQNIRSGKNQVTTVSDALREFYGKDQQTKKQVINKIFADPSQTRSGVKPHHSLAKANNNNNGSGTINVNSNGGFGLQKFVKVQKGGQVIDKYRSQVSSQNSAGSAAKAIKRQNSRSETMQGSRRMDKRTKNSNSSTDSKPPGAIYRKGSQPTGRKRNTSTSSERKEPLALGIKPLQTRTQLQTQARQQRVTSHSRIQLQQNSNFMMAPSSSRGDLSRGHAKGSSKYGLSNNYQQQPQGKTRLHRVRSAAGYKDIPSGSSTANVTATISSTKDNTGDYSNSSGIVSKTNQGSNSLQQARITAGQQAARKRVQLHRQRSAKKQIGGGIEERQSNTIMANNVKPPTANSGQASMPQFIQNQSSSIQSNMKPLPQQPLTTTAGRRQVSRDRVPQFDLGGQPVATNQQHQSSTSDALTAAGNNSSFMAGEMRIQDTSTATKAETSQEDSSRLRLLKRSSSQGTGSRRDIAGGRQNSRRSRDNSRNNNAQAKSFNQSGGPPNHPSGISEAVSQSNAFTEFKLICSPDQLSQQQNQNNATLPEIHQSISATVKKVNGKGEEIDRSSLKSTNAVHPATSSHAGKPPMSTSKRSAYSSKAESIKTVQSVHASPDKPPRGQLLAASPRRPLVLEPINNPPTVTTKPVDNTESKTYLEPEPADDIPAKDDDIEPKKTSITQAQEAPVPEAEEEEVNREEINIKWTPLLDKGEKLEARDYGYSFGSKKVSMGPGFVNLRFICHCLARAIKRHLEFSKGEQWFLQDLQKDQDDIDLEFSYQLPSDLKLTLNPKGVKIHSDDDEDDVNPFQREGEQSPVRDIETMDIEVLPKTIGSGAKTQPASSANSLKNKSAAQTTLIGEPEPEIIKSSDGEDNSARLSNFNNNNHQFSSNKPVADDIGEELEEDIDENYSDGAFEDPEEHSIQELRRDEMRKSVFEKDQERLNSYLNQRKVNELESQLKNKDKQIAQLTKLVQKGPVIRSEIMAISPAVNDTQHQQDQEEEDGFFDRGVKMDRAEWLMAQVDLDPIESHGSMEMSTTKFKTMHGKRFLNSENGAQGPLEDSRTSQSTRPAAVTEKKKSVKSYESGFIDVSEDKMREFVMTQLRYFDMRMEYDNCVFNEDQFIPMPSEKYIADYCKYVTIACKMENEIPIVCLVYLEKLLTTTGILLNKWNWRRIVLVCLCLASKIWDDDSLENVHFPKVMSDVTNYEINKLEQLFLEFIDYKLVIRGGEYAKYYFILRSMAEDINKEQKTVKISPFENTRRNKADKEEWAEFPLRAPISAGKMLELQRQEAKAEVYLKDRHEREFLDAFIGNKPGSRKDQTRHPSLMLDRTM